MCREARNGGDPQPGEEMKLAIVLNKQEEKRFRQGLAFCRTDIRAAKAGDDDALIDLCNVLLADVGRIVLRSYSIQTEQKGAESALPCDAEAGG